MCAPVDTHDSSYFGSLSRGTARALRSLRVCVRAYIFAAFFDVVLLNASFGCIGKPFFDLAWRERGFGFASAYHQVSVDV